MIPPVSERFTPQEAAQIKSYAKEVFTATMPKFVLGGTRGNADLRLARIKLALSGTPGRQEISIAGEVEDLFEVLHDGLYIILDAASELFEQSATPELEQIDRVARLRSGMYNSYYHLRRINRFFWKNL